MEEMLELLSTTDAAVKALNKSSRSQSPASSRSSRPSSGVSKTKIQSESHDSGICPTVNKGSTHTGHMIDKQGHGHEEDHWNKSSDESTTASDVLIRSTLADQEDTTLQNEKSFQSTCVENESAISKYSKSSFGMDNFNTSGPQKVKISSKRLREIKSPYDSPQEEQKDASSGKIMSKGKYLDNKKHYSQQEVMEPKIKNGQVNQQLIQKSNVKSTKSDNVMKKPISNNPKEIVTLQSTPQNKKTMKRNFTPPQKDTDKLCGSFSPPSNDSSECSIRPPLIERHTPPKQSKRKVTQSDMDGSYIESPHDKNLDGSLDLIPSKAVNSDSANYSHHSDKSQPEIVTVQEKIVEISAKNTVSDVSSVSDVGSDKIITVPEKIVTISARTSVSDDMSMSKDEEDEKIPPKLSNKFETCDIKVHTTGLRQGAPVNGVTGPDEKPHSDDVCVSKFTLTEKQKLIKESFARRYEQGGPKKRVVQPVLTVKRQHGEAKTGEIKNSAPGGQTTEAVTAAVAASAAIAATQPFLKAQRELETTMANILDKISVLQNGVTQKPERETLETESYKVKHLEQQLADLTEQRIKHLETLQEHQTVLQAKLLSFSRTPNVRSNQILDSKFDSSRSRSPTIRSPSRSPPCHRRYEVPKKAFSKTTVSDKVENKPNYDAHKQKYSSTSDHFPQSPLDTPNPRSRAPKPVALDTSDMKPGLKGRKNRGILEEILASDVSPRRAVPEPTQLHHSLISEPVPRSADFVGEKSPAVKRAEHLVEEVASVRDQMQNVVSDVERWRALEEKRKKDAEYEKAKCELLNGPSPLDPYLVSNKSLTEKFQSQKELASPYKSVPDLSHRKFNAPVLPGFSDAKEILQEVKQNKDCLEANLEAVFRTRQEAEVYALMENLYNEGYNSDLAHIRKIVDKKVATLRSQVEREVTDEVVMAELKKKQIPLLPKSSAPSQPTQRGMARARPGAKIDTGLNKIKGPSFGPPPSRDVKGKENKATVYKPPAKVKQRSPFEDEEYMTRVYGKATYQNKRTTTKEPYLHYQNVPKVKRERPSPAPEIKTGHLVKSEKTQTGPNVKQFYFNPAQGTYIPIASSSSVPIPGQLVPMAVPLGGPRMDGGLTAPVTVATPSGPLTSTPASRPQVTAAKNVTMVTVPAEEDLHRPPEAELGKQVLPNLDIDSEVSEVSPIPSKVSKVSTVSTRSKSRSRTSARGEVHFQSPQQSPSKNKFEVAYHAEEESLTDISDEDLNPEDAPGIALPGYQPPSPPQEEPPKPTLSQKMAERVPQPSSDVLAEDIRRRETLEHKAAEWIEQELMAHIISEMYPLRREEPQPELGHIVPDESVDSVLSEDNEQSMFVMDSIGRTGMQMFVDAGQAVDTNLVNALIREVLEEKVVSLLGQRPDEEVPKSTEARTSKITTTADVNRVVESRVVSMQEYEPKQLKTPQPTPKSSPRVSPVRVVSPPVTPPLSPKRTPREYFQPIPEPAPVLQESEPEDSESVDISEELRLLRGKILARQSTSPPVQVHDVETPVPTPVPEPEPEEERPLTPPQETPRKPEPVVEAPVVTKPVIVEPPPPPVVEPTITQNKMEQETVDDRLGSPKPWGNPSSPRPEENPDYMDGQEAEHDQPHPLVLSVAPTEEPPVIEQRPESPKRSVSPARKSSPCPSETESLTQSSISDSINQCISEGQWLLDKSEGEIADFPIDEVTKMKMTQKARQTAVDLSAASTLRGVEDMKDESGDFPASEGEFQYNPSVPPDKDPMLLLLSRLQHQPVRYVEQSIEQRQGQFQMSSDQVSDLLNHTGDLSMGQLRGSVNQSIGEVRHVRTTSGRQHGRQSPHRGSRSSKRDQFSPSRHYDREYRTRSPQYDRDVPERDYYNGRSERDYYNDRTDRGRQSPDHRGRQSPDHRGRQSPDHRGRQSPDRRGRMTPERDYGRQSPQRLDSGRVSPQRKHDGRRSVDRDRASPSRDRQSPVRGMSQRQSYELESGSPVPEYERYTVETTTTTRSRQKLGQSGGFQTDVSQGHSKPRRSPAKPSTPGGVSLGGMGGRSSPIKSALRKPPQVAKSQGMPEKSVTMSGTRTFHVRGSDEMQRSTDNYQSMSDRGTRTFTPDQMNMDELIESGYLMQNLSQSSTMDKNSLRATQESVRMSNERMSKRGSLGLTYSFETGGDSYSESELKRLMDTGSSRMSGTQPSTGGFYDEFR